MTSLTALINRSKLLSINNNNNQNSNPNPNPLIAPSYSSLSSVKLPTLRINAKGQIKQKNKNKSKRPDPKPLEDGLADDFIEEHLILRLPHEQANKLHSTLKNGEAPSDLSFIFHDSRRGVATYGKEKFRTKIVDLPCIIEAHKTYDNRQFYKISDICQMLLVEGPAPPNLDDATIMRPYEKIKDWRYDHGLTPPMKWVRKRRFRPRMPTSAIEEVEKEVLRLLEEDLLCEEIEIELRYLTEADEMEPENEGESEQDEGMLEYDNQQEYNQYNMVPYDPNSLQQPQYTGYDYSTMPIQNLSMMQQPQLSLQQAPYQPPPTPATPRKGRQAESDDDDDEDYEEEGDDVFDAAFDEAFQGDGDEDGDIFNSAHNTPTLVAGGTSEVGEGISMENGQNNLEEYEEVEIQFDDLGDSGNEEEEGEFEEVLVDAGGQNDADEQDQLRRDSSDLQTRIHQKDQEISRATNPILLKQLQDERKSIVNELMEKRNGFQHM